MLEHMALADHVEELGEDGHLTEVGPIEGLVADAGEVVGVSRITRSKFYLVEVQVYKGGYH